MRPEPRVLHRGGRGFPDFSCTSVWSESTVASLPGLRAEQTTRIRYHQPQKPTVRENGVAPFCHVLFTSAGHSRPNRVSRESVPNRHSSAPDASPTFPSDHRRTGRPGHQRRPPPSFPPGEHPPCRESSNGQKSPGTTLPTRTQLRHRAPRAKPRRHRHLQRRAALDRGDRFRRVGEASMGLEEILALANGRESETLEFKRTTGTRREAAATVCAMLNHSGGHVLFGVTEAGDVVRPAGE